MALRGYDAWKTTNPADEFLGPEPEAQDQPEMPDEEFNPERDPDCICWKERRKDCLVHGIDPDYARDEWLDRQMERDDE